MQPPGIFHIDQGFATSLTGSPHGRDRAFDQPLQLFRTRGHVMPGSFTEALKLLGFANPFIYAAATFAFFHYLDKKASGTSEKSHLGLVETERLRQCCHC